MVVVAAVVLARVENRVELFNTEWGVFLRLSLIMGNRPIHCVNDIFLNITLTQSFGKYDLYASDILVKRLLRDVVFWISSAGYCSKRFFKLSLKRSSLFFISAAKAVNVSSFGIIKGFNPTVPPCP